MKSDTYMENFKIKYNFKIIIVMCLGVFMIGVSVGFNRIANFGTDPFSCMNLGISKYLNTAFNLNISYGTCQLIVNLLLLAVMLLTLRRSLGLGTIVNMVGCGYIGDFTVWVFGLLGITTEGMHEYFIIRILLMLVGVLALGFGAALYMHCDIGIAPYDALGPILENGTKGKWKFQWIRISTDVLCVVIGFLCGSVVGVATAITAFFTGPLVTFFRKRLPDMHADRLAEE